MKIHRFEQTQILPVQLNEVWEFFSDPGNLDEMTPPDLAFKTVSGNEEEMFAGQIIVHRIQLLPMVWTTWVSEITKVSGQSYFIDEQRSGPYRFWHHLHRFTECDGGVQMVDRVHYALPFQPFGELGLFFVQARLHQIFAYRRDFLEEKFGGDGSSRIFVGGEMWQDEECQKN